MQLLSIDSEKIYLIYWFQKICVAAFLHTPAFYFYLGTSPVCKGIANNMIPKLPTITLWSIKDGDFTSYRQTIDY